MHEKGLYVIGNLYVDAEAIQFTYEITHYFQNVKTDYILLPSTPLFREAAAEMAVRLSASLLTDCIALSVDNGRLQGHIMLFLTISRQSSLSKTPASQNLVRIYFRAVSKLLNFLPLLPVILQKNAHGTMLLPVKLFL